jgi:HK97 family phage major capsid protein
MLKNQTRNDSRLAFVRDAAAAAVSSFQRSVSAEVRKVEGDDGLVEMSISSDAPYERWYGIEILSHEKKAIDLSRLKDGRHPLLLGHDVDRQIGVIKSVTLDTEAKKLRASAKFSRSALGQEIKQDVEDEIRSLISVGYFIEEIEEVKKEADGSLTVVRTMTGDEFRRSMEQEHGADFYRAGPAAARKGGAEPPVYIVTRWQPFEASVVPVPADVSVGIGRAAGAAPAPQPAASATPPVQSPILRTIMTDVVTKHPAELEIERRDAIIKLGDAYAKYLKPNDVRDAVQGSLTADGFRELIMQRLVSHHTAVNESEIGMSRTEKQRYSLGRALVAQLTGDWREAGFERECSQAVAKIMGRAAEGFFVPPDIFRRDFNIGTATEAGNLKPTEFRSDLFTDALRNALVLGRMGATILPGLTADVDLPRKSAAGAVGMLTEIGSAAETNPTTTKVTLAPKRIGAYVEVSKQALIQSALALENMLRDDLLMGAAVKLEDQCINGAGTGAEITGLRNTSGIGTVAAGANGAAPSWANIVDLESACANSNAEPDTRAGYVVNTKTRGKLKQTQFATNLPFIWQNGDFPLNGYRAGVTNNVPSNLTKGTSTTIASAGLFSSDWTTTTIGLFGAPDVTVDPYTKADTGQVKITLNQFADMKHRQPAAVAKIEDWLSN